MIEDKFIEIAKKVELYIQSDHYKGEIAAGNFSTRFHKLYNELIESKIISKAHTGSNIDVETKQVKFKDIKDGDLFLCWGDICINYDYPKMCTCIKRGFDKAEELGGISFYIQPSTDVFIAKK